MNVVVTGGLGFIGQAIVRELLIRRHRVTIVDYWKDRITEYERARYPILEEIYADSLSVREYIEPQEFLHRVKGMAVDVVIHAGAVVDTMDLGDRGLWEANVDYTRDLCAGLMPRSIPLVFMSSAAVYGKAGHPANPYGLSKLIGEKFVSELTRYAILRLFNVFGPLEHHKGVMSSVPFKLAQAYKDVSRFEMHSPDSSRDFVPVAAVVRVAVERAEHLTSKHVSNEIYDVGTGESTTFGDLDAMIQQAVRANHSVVKVIPMPEHLVGRYQFYTRADSPRRPDMTDFSTRQWINEYFKR